MKEIGEQLKKTREEHGVSLEEAAEDLALRVGQLENIESGNTRSFRDLYELKEIIKDYSKYLGLDIEKIVDEYNDFLFEKTSKISLEDIKEARVKKQEEKPSVISPYTKDFSKKIDFSSLAPFVLMFLILVFIFLVIFLIFRGINKKDDVHIELKERKDQIRYEYTY